MKTRLFLLVLLVLVTACSPSAMPSQGPLQTPTPSTSGDVARMKNVLTKNGFSMTDKTCREDPCTRYEDKNGVLAIVYDDGGFAVGLVIGERNTPARMLTATGVVAKIFPKAISEWTADHMASVAVGHEEKATIEGYYLSVAVVQTGQGEQDLVAVILPPKANKVRV